MNQSLTKPWHLFLFPLFFVIHVCAENAGLVPFRLAMLIFLEFAVIAGLFALISFWLLRNLKKASIASLYLLGFNLFFGSLHDWLRKFFPGSPFLKYSVIFCLFVASFIVLLIFLKRSKKNFRQACLFLNILFAIFIVTDIVKLGSFAMQFRGPHVVDLRDKLRSCDTCSKPDIYLIITDGYPGDTVLKNHFNYDNSAFTSALEERGFYILPNSTSNYNFTVYTLASLFNMDYIHHLDKERNVTQQDIYLCRDLIEESNFSYFLEKNGYRTENFSFMNVGGNNHKIRLAYFPPKRALFTSQTFVNRFFRNAGFNIPFLARFFYRDIRNADFNNSMMDSLLRKTSQEKSSQPRFVFSQLIIPHHPYFYDSLGNKINPDTLSQDSQQEKQNFLQYLVYTNKKLLSLTDHILNTSANPPVFILMSDHGYRRLTDPALNNYQFMTLNAVYFPDKNYSGFYEGMSTVNQLRVLLNNRFGQNLPLLKDSSSFFIEP